MLKIILPAALCIAAASIHKTPAGNTRASSPFTQQPAPPQKTYRDSVYLNNQALPATIYENMWMMREPGDKKDSAVARQLGIEKCYTWEQKRCPKNRVPVLRLTADFQQPFYIPPAQVLKACRHFEVWGNYCEIQTAGGMQNGALQNRIFIEFRQTAPPDSIARLLQQYRLQLSLQNNSYSGVYTTAFRRGEQIARISRKLRHHPFVVNIFNYLSNQPPAALDE